MLSFIIIFFCFCFLKLNLFILLKVINCLLKLRSDSKYRLGYCDESTILKYSPYLIVDYRRPSNVSLSTVSSLDSRSSTSSSFDEDFVPTEITYISLSSACQVVITALKCELGELRRLHNFKFNHL